jgi:hypothetical protein
MKKHKFNLNDKVKIVKNRDYFTSLMKCLIGQTLTIKMLTRTSIGHCEYYVENEQKIGAYFYEKVLEIII